MRRFTFPVLLLGFWLAPSCLGQQWELGGAAGFGAAKGATVSRDGQSAQAGFKGGLVAGVFGGQDLYQRLSGELRYMFRFSDLKLSSGGTEFTFGGRSHAVHYDLLFWSRRRDAPVRLFAAAGLGIRVYEGTGKETAVQPLSRYAVLTKTSQVKPLVSFGAGVRVKIAPRAFFRAEFRDYLTPFPRDVITPVPGSTVSGWVHDLTPMVGISASF